MNACRDAGMIPGDKLTNIAYQKIKDVHANLEAIRKVADRLTPVADLEEFRSMIEAVYADLEALANAADLMLAATPAGIAMLTAADVAAQRLLLQLGSAALLDGDTLALKTDVDTLSASLVAVADDLAALVLVVGQKAAQSDMVAAQQAIADLVLQVAALEDLVGTPGSGGGGGSTIGDILFDIEGRLQQVINTAQSHTQTLVTINNSVQELDGRITQVNELNTLLTNRVNTIDGALDVQAGVNNLLGQRITATEDGVAAIQQDVTAMGLTVDDLSNEVSATLLAVDGLTQRVTTAEDKVELFSSRTTTLEQNYEDLNEGQTALSQAIDALTLTTTDLDDRLTIEASRVTTLRAALRTAANLLSNSGFETGTSSWLVSNRGTGWLTVQPERNLQSATLRPPGTNTIGLTVPGLPSGNVSLQSVPVAVEPSKFYYLSGYVAGANATVRLEYRFLNSTGTQLSSGLVGASAPGGMSLANWTRRSVKVTAPADARTLILQLWITAATAIGPYGILLRPMVEEAWADQEGPSPWVEGASGFGDAMSEANAGLIARVDALEDGVDALAQDFSDLSAQVGDLSADAFNALTARVTATENENTSQANDITNLQSSLGDVEDETAANASAISALTARVSDAEGELTSISGNITELESSIENIGSDNLLPNSSLEDQVTSNRPRYWTRAFGNGAPATVDSFVPSNLGGSTNAWRLEGTGYNGTTHFIDISQFVGDGLERPKARPGDRFVFTAYVRGSVNANVQLVFQYLNSSASTITTYSIPYVSMTSNYVRLKYVAPAAPAGTTQVRVYVRVLPTDSSAFWVEVDNLQLQEGTTPTAYMPSATLTGEANAAATSALTTRVTSAENTLITQAGLTTAIQTSLNVMRKQFTVLDTGFEEDNTWTTGGNFSIQSSTSWSKSGRRYLRIIGGTAGQNIMQTDRFEVQTGKTIRCGFWARRGESVPNDYVRLSIRYYGGDGAQLSFVATTASLSSASGTDVYQKVVGTTTPPANAAFAAIVIQSNHTAGQWFVDDLFVEIMTEAEAANASAISSLDSRTTATENSLTAQGNSLTQVQAQLLGNIGGNRLSNPSFINGSVDWWNSSHGGVGMYSPRLGGYHIAHTPGAGLRYIASWLAKDTWNSAVPGEVSTFSASVNCDGPWRLAIQFRNDAGSTLLESAMPDQASTAGQWVRTSVTSAAAPPGTTWWVVVLYATNTTTHHRMFHPKMELGSFVTPFSEEGATTANAVASQSLEGRVTTAEGNITAAANAITNVRAELSGGGNLIPNAEMAVDISNWTLQVLSGGWAGGGGPARDYAGDPWRPVGMHNIGLNGGGTPTTAHQAIIRSDFMPVTAGKRYMLSAYLAAHRATAYLQIVWMNADASAVTGVTSSTVGNITSSINNGGNDLSNWSFCYTPNDASAVAPAGTYQAYIRVVADGMGLNQPYIWLLRPMLEEVGPQQTVPSKWNSGGTGLDSKYASITQTLNTRATTLENGQTTLLARYALRLDVNGYSIGWEANNNGSQGAIKFRADLFEVSSPTGGARTEYSNGNWRVYDDAGTLRVAVGVNI